MLVSVAHHIQRYELQQFGLVLRENAFFKQTQETVGEHVAALVTAQEVSFVLVEVDYSLVQVCEQFQDEQAIFQFFVRQEPQC